LVELIAPRQIILGQPFNFSFRSEARVAGRLRLTAGKDAVEFTLDRGDRPPETSAGHRLRGKQGSFQISNWGEHEVGAELVLRFEGQKLWLTVAAG